MEDGTLLGDPATRTLTKHIKSLGWTVEHPSAFDVLPIVLEWPGKPPVWRDVPSELILEVPIRHPDHPGLEELGLKWYALPAVAAMSLELGGLVYTLAPFNGFYMSTEIEPEISPIPAGTICLNLLPTPWELHELRIETCGKMRSKSS